MHNWFVITERILLRLRLLDSTISCLSQWKVSAFPTIQSEKYILSKWRHHYNCNYFFMANLYRIQFKRNHHGWTVNVPIFFVYSVHLSNYYLYFIYAFFFSSRKCEKLLDRHTIGGAFVRVVSSHFVLFIFKWEEEKNAFALKGKIMRETNGIGIIKWKRKITQMEPKFLEYIKNPSTSHEIRIYKVRMKDPWRDGCVLLFFSSFIEMHGPEHKTHICFLDKIVDFYMETKTIQWKNLNRNNLVVVIKNPFNLL